MERYVNRNALMVEGIDDVPLTKDVLQQLTKILTIFGSRLNNEDLCQERRKDREGGKVVCDYRRLIDKGSITADDVKAKLFQLRKNPAYLSVGHDKERRLCNVSFHLRDDPAVYGQGGLPYVVILVADEGAVDAPYFWTSFAKYGEVLNVRIKPTKAPYHGKIQITVRFVSIDVAEAAALDSVGKYHVVHHVFACPPGSKNAVPRTPTAITHVPTTPVPTTPVPTTSVPTTSVPTTSVPTASVPTTPVPTTTTHVPTTTTPVPTATTAVSSAPTTPSKSENKRTNSEDYEMRERQHIEYNMCLERKVAALEVKLAKLSSLASVCRDVLQEQAIYEVNGVPIPMDVIVRGMSELRRAWEANLK